MKDDDDPGDDYESNEDADCLICGGEGYVLGESFGDPLWSLWADLLMWSKMIAGTMDAEVDRVMSSNGHHHEPESGDAAREEISREASVLRERQSLN